MVDKSFVTTWYLVSCSILNFRFLRHYASIVKDFGGVKERNLGVYLVKLRHFDVVLNERYREISASKYFEKLDTKFELKNGVKNQVFVKFF